jgi:phosphatidylethanolamine/phosphatidyl-N-methylethanolamine N-methyltransferase
VQGDLLKFLTQFRHAPRSVGAIVPSSDALARAMIAPIDFAKARAIVEFGPGTGVMTAAILNRLSPDTKYVGIEINEAFHRTLTIRFPDLQFFNRGAQDVTDILAALEIDGCDAIVCGLPWASLPIELQNRIMAGMLQVLRPGGVFVTFAYLQGLVLPAAGALRRRLKAEFSRVETTRIVWGNVPPAFAYVCYR